MQKQQKQPQKRGAAGAVCIAVLLWILSAEAAMLVKQYRSTQHGAFRAAGTVRTANARTGYLAHYRGIEPPERLTAALRAELDAAYAAYLAGDASYADAVRSIRGLQKLGISALQEPTEKYLTAAEKTAAARQAFSAAQEAEQRGDDAEAIRQYRLVTKDDETCFRAAEQALPAAEARLREKALAAAAEQDAAADYDAEIAGLEQACAVLEHDEILQTAYRQAVSRRTVTLRHTAMQHARISADQQDYKAAFAALAEGLSGLPDDALLQYVQQNLRARYIQYVQEQTALRANQGKTAEAEALLTEAESLLPDAPELETVRQNLNTYQPQKLSMTGTADLNEFFKAEQTLTDRRGTEYAADGNLYYSFDEAATGRRYASADFTLNGQYGVLTLTVAPLASYTAENSVILEITGDGKELRTVLIDKNAAAQQIRTDVSGVKTLRLRVYPIGAPDLRNAGILVADGSVQKAGAAS